MQAVATLDLVRDNDASSVVETSGVLDQFQIVVVKVDRISSTRTKQNGQGLLKACLYVRQHDGIEFRLVFRPDFLKPQVAEQSHGLVLVD